MKIDAPAGRYGQPRRYSDVVLQKNAGHNVLIGEARNIFRTISVALRCRTDDPCIPPKRAACGDFAKQHFVPVALADLTELVDMVLQRGGEAGSEHITLIDN